MIKKSQQNITYPIALLMSTSVKKNLASLGRDVGLSGDTISKILTETVFNTVDLVNIAKKIFKKKPLYLLIDDTLISKIYSKNIEGACDNYLSSDKKSKRSLCSIVAMLTDGETAIPIDQSLWISLEFNPNNYRKKWEIARELIIKIMPLIQIKTVVADGLYAIAEFMQWLNQNNIKFEMRLHANRVVYCKGTEEQIKKHPRFKVNGKNPTRTLPIIWHDMHLYATVLRRLMKNGDFSIVYQIANYKTSAREHIKTYKYRWNIEKFFRTAKQNLGLNDCMVRKQENQEKHIQNVFLAYIIAQIQRVKLKLKNVEMAIQSIKQMSFIDSYNRFARSGEIFDHA